MTEIRTRRSWREVGLYAAAAALLPSLPGCPGQAEPGLLKRYAAYEVADTAGLVDVTVFSTPADAWSGSARLHELSASAQSELVEAVAGRTASADALLRTLGRPIGGAPDREAGAADRTRFRRRLVISAENHASRPSRTASTGWKMRPAARISRLRVVIGLDPEQARFLSWDRFASRYETVDLGEMSSRRTRGLELDLEAAADGALADALDAAGLEVGGTAILDEELPLRRRYVSTGMLRPDSIVLLQEGAVGVDLTGNGVVEVEIDVADAPSPTRTFTFQGLFGAEGEPSPPDSVGVVPAEIVHAPRGTGDVVGALRFESVVRTVERGAGDATWAEGDDHVRFLVEPGPARSVTLVPADELKASAWQLATPGCRQFLHIESDIRDEPALVQLGSAGDAFELLRWLRGSRHTEIGRRQLYIDPARALTGDDIDGLGVQIVPLNWELSEGTGCR